jgi:hypothetical protein
MPAAAGQLTAICWLMLMSSLPHADPMEALGCDSYQLYCQTWNKVGLGQSSGTLSPRLPCRSCVGQCSKNALHSCCTSFTHLWLSMQHEEVKACVEEYAVVGIWDSELSAAGEPVITFNEACRPWTQ